MDIYAKLQELNITLPPIAIPAAAYVPVLAAYGVLAILATIRRYARIAA